MSNKQAIKELESIIAFADELKSKATRLRKSLGGVDRPASPKGPKKLTQKKMNDILLRRRISATT